MKVTMRKRVSRNSRPNKEDLEIELITDYLARAAKRTILTKDFELGFSFHNP